MCIYQPELFFYGGSSLLEGPCMSPSQKSILCVSIEQSCIYLIDLSTRAVRTYQTHGQVGCAVFEDEGHILVAAHEGIYRLHVATGDQIFIKQFNENPSLRYNDGKRDQAGRFLVGTTGYQRYAENENCLYSWDGKRERVLLKNITISNGLGFSLDNRFMYFIDTPTRRVDRYHYDILSGDAVFDQSVIYIEDGSMPDGMCVDAEDMIWVAQWGGYKVCRWNPYTGEKLCEVMLPCKNVTSCCIGGDKGEWLFVTTAMHDDGTKSEEMAGGLFRVRIR